MLSVESISKQFDRNRPPAVNNVSFAVEKGRICGLLGHNGAGKSTALGVVLGMVYPDSGEVTIGGVAVQKEREKAIAKVGAIFEAPAFYDYLSGWKNLQVFTSYSGGVSRSMMKEMVEWVGLTDRIHDRISKYSHGMRQRLALAQALLPHPELLILDEPTDGLDPEGIVEFREQILELRDRLGLTVLLSSHLLSEVEQVCDEVVILQKGKKVYDGGVQNFGGDEITFFIEARNPVDLERSWEKLGGRKLGDEFLISRDREPSECLSRLIGDGVKVCRFTQQENSLESLYLQVSSREIGEDAG
ncbi:MAG: ABC transporter ATP-binding protein [Verrucomicrobiales bacterium]|nr:ABC transporter ATP-binding protein [Verrucomicrobiales bacterium]